MRGWNVSRGMPSRIDQDQYTLDSLNVFQVFRFSVWARCVAPPLAEHLKGHPCGWDKGALAIVRDVNGSALVCEENPTNPCRDAKMAWGAASYLQ